MSPEQAAESLKKFPDIELYRFLIPNNGEYAVFIRNEDSKFGPEHKQLRKILEEMLRVPSISMLGGYLVNNPHMGLRYISSSIIEPRASGEQFQYALQKFGAEIF